MRTEDKLKEIVVGVLGCDHESIRTESKLIEDLGADNLDSVDIAISVEDAFGIEVDDAEIENSRTFGDLLAVVKRARGVSA